jgi:hypothetical protein
MQQYLSTQSLIIGIVLGVILVGVWFFSFFIVPSKPATSAPVGPKTATSTLFAVKDQEAGQSVSVSNINFASSTLWVAVREMNGETLGNVLGAARITGEREGLTVSLLRATQPKRRYAIELYRDDSGGGFDPAKNSVYIDFGTGEPVIGHFSTTE